MTTRALAAWEALRSSARYEEDSMPLTRIEMEAHSYQRRQADALEQIAGHLAVIAEAAVQLVELTATEPLTVELSRNPA